MPSARLKPKGSVFLMVSKAKRVLPPKCRQNEAGVWGRAFIPTLQTERRQALAEVT